MDNNQNLAKDYFFNSQQTSTMYYNSFHMYDQFGNINNTEYGEIASTIDLSLSKESINTSNNQSYDCQINWVQPIGRRRRQRTVFTQNHIQQLENIFIYNQYPDIQLRESLATQMNISESRIQVWFKNRRTRARIAQRQQYKNKEKSNIWIE